MAGGEPSFLGQVAPLWSHPLLLQSLYLVPPPEELSSLVGLRKAGDSVLKRRGVRFYLFHGFETSEIPLNVQHISQEVFLQFN